jgi:RNA polymerase sigma-70 factor, ECF subfamily
VPTTVPPPTLDTVTALVQRHQPALRSYVRWLGASAETVDEVVQDTFVAALTQPNASDDPVRTGAWLRTVARHLLLRRWRDRGGVERAVELDEAAVAWERWLGADDGDGLREALRACLAAVQPRHGEALRMRYGEGASVAAIGARLGVGAAGAETLLRRVRQILRACIERRLAR